MKGGSNEIFTYLMVFREVISFIYQKFLLGDRVPLRNLDAKLMKPYKLEETRGRQNLTVNLSGLNNNPLHVFVSELSPWPIIIPVDPTQFLNFTIFLPFVFRTTVLI